MSCKQLCENEKCVECFNKSFASSEKSKFLQNANPRLIYKHSEKNIILVVLHVNTYMKPPHA